MMADLRLAGPAVAAWIAVAATLLLRASSRLPALSLAAVTLALSLAVWRPPWRRGDRGMAVLRATAGICLAGAAGSAAAASTVHEVTTGPVVALARERAAVELRVVLRSDPTILASAPGRPALALADARLIAITPDDGHGHWQRASASVLLLAGRAERWRGLLPGQQLQLFGRLAVARGHDLVAATVSVRGSPTLMGRPPFFQRMAGRVRAGLREACAALPDPAGGLLPALLDGDTSGLRPDVVADFRAAGLTHLVAVSGANIALVFGVVLGVARALGLPRLVTVAVGALALAAVVVIARPSPSVVRAAAMAAVTLLAMALGRPRSAAPALFTSVIVVVVVDPALAVAPGFVLSVAATAALLLLAPSLRRSLPGWVPAWLRGPLAVAVAAQVGCAPWIVLWWGQFGLVAVPANVLAEPAVPAATLAAAATAVVASVAPGLARLVAWLGYLPTWWLVTVAHRCADVPAANLVTPSGVAAAVVVAVGLAVALAAVRRPWLRRLSVGAVLGATAGWGAVGVSRPDWPPPSWAVALCHDPHGLAVLARAGPDSAVSITSGADAGSLARCVGRLHVGRVVAAVVPTAAATGASGLAALTLHGHAPEVLAPPGERLPTGSGAVVALAAGQRFTAGGATVTFGPADPRTGAIAVRVSVAGIAVDVPVTADLAGDVPVTPDLASAGPGPADALVLTRPTLGHDVAAIAARRPALVALTGGAGPTTGAAFDVVAADIARAGIPVVRCDDGRDTVLLVRSGRVLVTRRGEPPVHLATAALDRPAADQRRRCPGHAILDACPAL